MTDWERLVAKTTPVLYVEEVTKHTTVFNCFGDKIDEHTETTSNAFQFKEDGWQKGIYHETD